MIEFAVSCFERKVARLREIQISYKIVLMMNETMTAFGSDGLPVKKIKSSKDKEREDSLSREFKLRKTYEKIDLGPIQ